MFFHLFLGDVEHILDVFESCVLVDFRIQQEIQPKMNDGFHRRWHELTMSIHWFRDSIENVASIADLHNFFRMYWNLSHGSMIRESHVSRFW